MLEMKVTIAPTTELVTVLDKLAAAIGGGSKCRETVPEAPKAPAGQATPLPAAPVPVQTGTPSVNPVASTIPTAAPQYTVEMLANAARRLLTPVRWRSSCGCSPISASTPSQTLSPKPMALWQASCVPLAHQI